MNKPVVRSSEEMSDIIKQVEQHKKLCEERGEKILMPQIVDVISKKLISAGKPGMNVQTFYHYRRKIGKMTNTDDEKNQIQLFDAKATIADLKPRRKRGPNVVQMEPVKEVKSNNNELVKAFMEQSAAQQKIINLLSEQQH